MSILSPGRYIRLALMLVACCLSSMSGAVARQSEGEFTLGGGWPGRPQVDTRRYPMPRASSRESRPVETNAPTQPELVGPHSTSIGGWAPGHHGESPSTEPRSTLQSRLATDDYDWWLDRFGEPILPNRQAFGVDLDHLVHWYLANSPLVMAISQEPLIREAQVIESRSLFDPVAFVDSKFSDRNDPVGNLLLTDDALLQEHIWSASAGVRKRLQTGGSLELAQRLGFQNSNARFFFPQDQGTATLSLNYRQPLLRGAGGQVNRSQIVLADIAQDVAWDRFSGELQSDLLRLIQSYWHLYYTRCVLLQKQRNVERSAAILHVLEGRQALDSLPSQIARARAAVASRTAELANAQRDLLNAETELRRMVADATQAGGATVELIPTESPNLDYAAIPVEESIHQALHLRPELAQAFHRVQSAAVESQVAKNQLLPALGLLFEVYASGLQGNTGIERAWVQQFSGTTPGYIAGLEFEMPLGNRQARAQWQQRRLQMARAQAELQTTLQSIVAEVQIAARTRDSAFETLRAAAESIMAARGDLEQQTSRWESFALLEGDLADGVTPTTLLDQLLESQQRLTAAEMLYCRALTDYQASQVAVHRAAGTLLMARQITTMQQRTQGLPQIDVHSLRSR